ncbi:MAG: carbamoyltransferase HypF, partial [Actinobacteria bacterium]
ALRERKRRWGKPLAVMVASLDEARALCEVDADEADLLAGPVRPIVLLRRRADTAPGAPALADSIAPRLREVGVMLPYTPLHRLLIDAAGVPLVMTSGNLSDEPIATGNAEALTRLAPIVDAVLSHDRGIRSRYDDSVVRVVDGRFESVRRARGYAPFPLRLPHASDAHILAAGPEQKNTFALVRDDLAFVSQHVGDLENADTLEAYESTLALYERLFRIEPQLVAHDLHPEYLSTKFALGLGLPTVGVQHHHAHVASVLAEHAHEGRCVGIAFDGTGYGTDGRIWGGEVLLADLADFERFAHLREVPMPGGASAVRRPARMAVGTLHALGLLDHPGAAPLLARLADGELETLVRMADRGVNSPLTSSMGRLFDSVAAIAGVRDDALYEGQAAIELEAAADPGAHSAYAFALVPGAATPLVIDPEPVLEAALDDVARGVQSPVVSMRFHRAVADAVVRVALAAADAAAAKEVAVCGGVFMNRILLGSSMAGLAEAGLTPLTHLRLPMNDAAVSFGQAAVACARRREI